MKEQLKKAAVPGSFAVLAKGEGWHSRRGACSLYFGGVPMATMTSLYSCTEPSCDRVETVDIADDPSKRFMACAMCCTVYCSAECQRRHYPIHKRFCKSIDALRSRLEQWREKTPLYQVSQTFMPIYADLEAFYGSLGPEKSARLLEWMGETKESVARKLSLR